MQRERTTEWIRERVERMAAWPKSLARGAKKYIYKVILKLERKVYNI